MAPTTTTDTMPQDQAQQVATPAGSHLTKFAPSAPRLQQLRAFRRRTPPPILVRHPVRLGRTTSVLVASHVGSAVVLVLAAMIIPTPALLPLPMMVAASAVVMLLLTGAFGLLTSSGFSGGRQARRLVAAALLGYLTTALVWDVSAGAAATGARVAAAAGFAVMAFGLALLSQACVHHFFGKRRWWGRPVAVYVNGDINAAAALVRSLRRHPELGLTPVAALTRSHTAIETLEGVPCVAGPESLNRLSRHSGIQYVVSVGSGGRGPLLMKISVATAYFAKLVPHRPLGPMIGMTTCHGVRPWRTPWAKRALDILVCLAVTLVMGPVVLLAAAMIKLDRGPTFFFQKRIGQYGKPFRIFKFRTMCPNAGRMMATLPPELLAEYELYGKLRRDPRVTSAGRWLRRTSLDELPQVFNVLRGDMSLVGFRPHLMHQRGQLVAESRCALRAVPGLTGVWQISGRSDVTFSERLAMDMYYAEAANVWLDLYLLARTVPVVLTGAGAY